MVMVMMVIMVILDLLPNYNPSSFLLISFRPTSAAKPWVTWDSSSHYKRRVQSKEEGCLLPNYIHCNRVFQ